MNKLDKFVAAAFKAVIVVYFLVLVFKAEIRPDIYRLVSVPIETCVGILIVYLLGSWTLRKLGLFEAGKIRINRRALLKTSCAALALILLCAGIEYQFHNFSLTHQAIDDLQSSTDGKNSLGVPIRIGWFITGAIRINGDAGAANLSIPVKGSKSAGELEVGSIKKDGAWHIIDLYLIADGNKSVLPISH
jgi:hypothetical protein